MPQHCFTVSKFPRNAMGKILRRKLIEEAAARSRRSRPSRPDASKTSRDFASAQEPTQRMPERFAGALQLTVKLALAQPLSATISQWAQPLLGEPDWGQLLDVPQVLPIQGVQRLTVIDRLVRLLLTQAGVPLFTPLLVSRVQRIPSNGTPITSGTDPVETGSDLWRVTWHVPVEPFLPNTLYKAAMKAALILLAIIEQHKPTPEAIAALYARIEQGMVKPLKSAVPGDKLTVRVLAAAHGLGIPFFHVGLGNLPTRLGFKGKTARP